MFKRSTSLALLPLFFPLIFLGSAFCQANNATATCTNWTFFTSGQAYGINRWGVVVGLAGQFPSLYGYIRYSDGTFKTYIAPNASNTIFLQRNKLGVTVGYYTDIASGAVHGIVVSGSNAVTVDYPGAVETTLSGINYRGTIVGGSGEGAFKLKNGVFTSIRYPSSSTYQTFANSISDKGVIVGSYRDIDSDQRHGFVLANGVCETLDNPKGIGNEDGTTLADINGSGAIVGWYFVGVGIGHSFIYINGVFKEIAPPNTNYTLVSGINGYGDVTGTTNFNSGGYTSFTAHCE
jgi:hypothetical protein